MVKRSVLSTDADVEILKSPPATTRPLTGGGKGPVELDLDFDADVSAILPKRESVGSRLVKFFKKLRDSLPGRDIVNNSIEAHSIKTFFKKLGDTLFGRDVVDDKIQVRSVEIDPQLLAELQALVNIILLRAEGKDSCKRLYPFGRPNKR
ncbi:hypothetical protein BDM02DRAFT_947105 [Thelephora ganbajun]|uniref:Uncharacterized protein n=1 Tax=Thelephora ganbajun TaxID=370292 RepID=A0ACB6Z4J5_THEGA|nr:hypothetical protein BDM02DRAFT_947105 [Thelephora ganbajun]